jgi:recombination protein RecR
MAVLPSHIQELVKSMSSLPGIGQKSASRLVFYLLRDGGDLAMKLSEDLAALKTKTVSCPVCYGVMSASRDICDICSSPHRDHQIICVVEKQMDMIAMESAGIFKGLYHILNGAISPMSGVNPEDLMIDELERRVNAGNIKEVILATSAGLEGDTTGLYIQNLLAGCQVRVTKLARGLSVGADLEYADLRTLSQAFAGRS